MSTGSDATVERELRQRALRLMLAQCGADAHRLLRHHPEADEIGAVPEGVVPLQDLLWDELELLERRRMRLLENTTPRERRSAVGFFLRRRTLARYTRLKHATDRLPEMWVRIIRMGPEQIGRAGYELGIRMLSAALAHLAEGERAEFLRGLTELQHKAVTRCVREGNVPQHGGALAELWLAGYRFARDSRGDKKAVEILGRLLLGTLFQRLAPALQQEAIRTSKSTLCARLPELPALELAHEEDEEVAERFATEVVAIFSPALDQSDERSGSNPR